MDVRLHRLEALIARSCVECERLQPDDEQGWKMYMTVDDKPALYCGLPRPREDSALAARAGKRRTAEV